MKINLLPLEATLTRTERVISNVKKNIKLGFDPVKKNRFYSLEYITKLLLILTRLYQYITHNDH